MYILCPHYKVEALNASLHLSNAHKVTSWPYLTTSRITGVGAGKGLNENNMIKNSYVCFVVMIEKDTIKETSLLTYSQN